MWIPSYMIPGIGHSHVTFTSLADALLESTKALGFGIEHMAGSQVRGDSRSTPAD